MAKWKIPVEWTMCSVLKIEADTLSEAMEIARDDVGSIPIPEDGEYIDGSWQITEEDEDIIRELYNKNKPDEIVTLNSCEDFETALIEKISEAHYTDIEDFLGYPITSEVLEDLEDRIKCVLAQMPEEEIMLYKQKFLPSNI